jgi:hypothetical protein
MERPSGSTGTEEQQGREGAHTKHPEAFVLVDVGDDGGHGRNTDRRCSGIARQE